MLQHQLVLPLLHDLLLVVEVRIADILHCSLARLDSRINLVRLQLDKFRFVLRNPYVLPHGAAQALELGKITLRFSGKPLEKLREFLHSAEELRPSCLTPLDFRREHDLDGRGGISTGLEDFRVYAYRKGVVQDIALKGLLLNFYNIACIRRSEILRVGVLDRLGISLNADYLAVPADRRQAHHLFRFEEKRRECA